MTIRELYGYDLEKGLVETLRVLDKDLDLPLSKIRDIFQERLKTSRTFAAVIDGEIVGICSLLIERKFLHNGSYAGRIEDVAVREEYQGKGIGEKLVVYTTNTAKNAGCYKVTLSCYDYLIPFYEKCGYSMHDIGMRIELK